MAKSALDMGDLPPIFILPTHLETEELHEAEDALYRVRGRLSYRASEARIFLGKIGHKKRAAFDLRARGVWTREEPLPLPFPRLEPTPKRRKLDRKRDGDDDDDNDNDDKELQFVVGLMSDDEPTSSSTKRRQRQPSEWHGTPLARLTDHIVLLRLDWLDDCVKGDRLLPIDAYLVYTGKIIEKPTGENQPAVDRHDGVRLGSSPDQLPAPFSQRRSSIIERAKADAAATPSQSSSSVPFHRRKFGQQKSSSPTQIPSSPPPKLYRATTSELGDGRGGPSKLPDPPSWMTEPHPRPMYSCLRDTPPLETNPNRHFIGQLARIKEARLLTLDEIGVRAYSTSIASLSAYPHRVTSPLEITRLPGCNDKIASLWVEWHESVTLSDRGSAEDHHDRDRDSDGGGDDDSALDHKRFIPSVHDLFSSSSSQDQTLTHIRQFHQIWGVGPETARKFHLHNGWTDLDDVVEHGWAQLSRAQQIGVKFFDEFALPIPRAEVESIARTVLRHARLARSVPPDLWTNDINPRSSSSNTEPRDFVAVLVGGYRRGKDLSGDVDLILSHRDDRMTLDLVVDVLAELEAAGYVTHTLTLHTATSERGQATLPFRSVGHGGGFDSLDKALCVWRNGEGGVHRRVDIIVSPWRTVGCAVLGWSGGTTFQRDLRRWCKRERGWKFDSSGVRDRGNGGLVLDLEGLGDGEDGEDGWEDRERRLMERLGIGFRRAEMRCTG